MAAIYDEQHQPQGRQESIYQLHSRMKMRRDEEKSEEKRTG